MRVNLHRICSRGVLQLEFRLVSPRLASASPPDPAVISEIHAVRCAMLRWTPCRARPQRSASNDNYPSLKTVGESDVR